MKRALRDKFLSQEIISILCDLHNNSRNIPYPIHSKIILSINRLADLNDTIINQLKYGQREMYNLSDTDKEELAIYKERHKKALEAIKS